MSNPVTTLSDWLSGLLGDITKQFNGASETGVDIGVPYHTPIYALSGGTVEGAGYYGGGGVVSLLSNISAPNYSGQASVYYQHLSDLAVQPGETVQAGQLIGWSGGQLGYGDHPSTSQYSNGPHIEVGINAPYGGIWGSQVGPNINPLPWLQNLAGGALGGAGGVLLGGSNPLNGFDPTKLLSSATTGLKLAGWFLLALAIITFGALLLFQPQISAATDQARDTAGKFAEVAALGA